MTSTNRNRITLDMPTDTQDSLQLLAQEFDVSISQLATFLIRRGLQDLPREEILEARVPTNGKRFEFRLKWPRHYPHNVAPKRVKTA